MTLLTPLLLAAPDALARIKDTGLDLTLLERAHGLLGIAVCLGIAWLMS